MDSVKNNFERKVGEHFIDWYNQKNQTGFVFHGRQENPDLSYVLIKKNAPPRRAPIWGWGGWGG
jgi:hypothetical protein